MKEELILKGNAGSAWALPLARLIYAESEPNAIRLRFPLYLIEIKLESKRTLMPTNLPSSSREFLKSILQGLLPSLSVHEESRKLNWEAGEVAAITVHSTINKSLKKEQL